MINDEDRDRLLKIRPLIDILQKRCRKVYQPGKNLSVDESLVLYKGRLHFKPYIKTKRARFGIKLYKLTSSDGITLDFLIYCGKGMFKEGNPNSGMPSTERIPTILMQEYFGKGHTLHTDNYYTSPSLALHFLNNSTHLCGTVHTNRRMYSKKIIEVPLEKGTATFFRPENNQLIIARKYRLHKDKAGK